MSITKFGYVLPITILTLTTLTSILAGCASNSGNNKYKSSRGNPLIPKSQKFNLPGGDSPEWRYLGTTDNNQIADEINDSSIKPIGNQIYKFQDRKTIISPNEYQYSKNQPKYKFAIGNWQLDCTNKQYLLISITIYDTYGNQIKTYDYATNNNVKWLKLGDGSIANAQYNYTCLNINRNLGY